MHLFPFSQSVSHGDDQLKSPLVPPPDWLVLPDEFSSFDNDSIPCKFAQNGTVTSNHIALR